MYEQVNLQASFMGIIQNEITSYYFYRNIDVNKLGLSEA